MSTKSYSAMITGSQLNVFEPLKGGQQAKSGPTRTLKRSNTIYSTVSGTQRQAVQWVADFLEQKKKDHKKHHANSHPHHAKDVDAQ